MSGPGAAPDPASLHWDTAAAAFLTKVIAAKGAWHAQRVVDPGPQLEAALRSMGYDPFGRDNKSGRGTLNARDAWRRAFVRALYRANDRRRGGPGRALEVQVGARLPRRGVIPPGRPVRARVRRGGAAAMRAVARKPEAEQWAYGGPGQSQPGRRQWR